MMIFHMPSLQLADLRWKAPREILDADGVIKNKDNNFCIQEPSSMGGAPGEGIFTGSEDCLYLDIKTPKKNSSELIACNVLDSWRWQYFRFKRFI